MKSNWIKEAEEILNLAGGIVVGIGTDGTVSFINERGCRLLECSREEVMGGNWFEMFVAEDIRSDIIRIFHQVIHDRVMPEGTYENSIRTRKGNTRFISWYNAIITEENGKVSGLLGLGEDVSDKNLLLHQLSVLEENRRKQLVSAVLETQEKERYELAHELHDNVNQILTTCKLLLAQESDSGNPSPLVVNATCYLQQAIDEIRNISHKLNPVQLNNADIAEAIEELAMKINLAGKPYVLIKIHGKKYFEHLQPSISLSIFRIIQEQLSNIIKYADAQQVDITIHITEAAIEVEIKDNGKGFDLKEVNRGLGLKGIYSRVELHNGTVYINTAPGEGCTLSVHIPYSKV